MSEQTTPRRAVAGYAEKDGNVATHYALANDGTLYWLDGEVWTPCSRALPQPGQATLAALDMAPVPTRAREAVDRSVARQETKASEQPQVAASGEPACPKCSGRMWDNRVGKRNPKAPDFKCRDKSCDGVIWPPREGEVRQPAMQAASTGREQPPRDFAPVDDDDSIPF
jgi:hypothetical protein